VGRAGPSFSLVCFFPPCYATHLGRLLFFVCVLLRCAGPQTSPLHFFLRPFSSSFAPLNRRGVFPPALSFLCFETRGFFPFRLQGRACFSVLLCLHGSSFPSVSPFLSRILSGIFWSGVVLLVEGLSTNCLLPDWLSHPSFRLFSPLFFCCFPSPRWPSVRLCAGSLSVTLSGMFVLSVHSIAPADHFSVFGRLFLVLARGVLSWAVFFRFKVYVLFFSMFLVFVT